MVIVWLQLLLGCTSSDAGVTAEIELSVQAWRSSPDPEHLEAVRANAERAMEVEQPSAALSQALGDALANVLLRPDLALPYLEPHREQVPAAWLDALLRAHQLDRLSAEYEALRGEPLDTDHLAAQAISEQAARFPGVGVRDLQDGVAAARLVEEGVARARRLVDIPIDIEVGFVSLAGRPVEVVVARATIPADPDPLTSSGVIPAVEGRRRVIVYGRTGDAATLGALGRSALVSRPDHTISVFARTPDGVLGGEGKLVGGVVFLFSATELGLEKWASGG